MVPKTPEEQTAPDALPGRDLEAGKASSLVPEVYFDLIARVTPGAVLLLAVLSTQSECNLKSLAGISIVLLGVLGLLLSYWLGSIIDAATLQARIRSIRRRRPKLGRDDMRMLADFCRGFGQHDMAATLTPPESGEERSRGRSNEAASAAKQTANSEREKNALDTTTKQTDKEKEEKALDDAIVLVHHFVKDSGRPRQELLVKLAAEISLCFNSAYAAFVAAIMLVALGLAEHGVAALTDVTAWLELVALACVFGFALRGARYRQERFSERQLDLFRIVWREVQPSQDPVKHFRRAVAEQTHPRAQASLVDDMGRAVQEISGNIKRPPVVGGQSQS